MSLLALVDDDEKKVNKRDADYEDSLSSQIDHTDDASEAQKGLLLAGYIRLLGEKLNWSILTIAYEL